MKKLILILALLGFIGCSTSEQVTDEDRAEEETTEQTEEEGEDDVGVETSDDFERPFRDVEAPFGYPSRTVYSLFRDEYRNEEWDIALKYNRYLISEHPKEMEDVDSYRGDRQFDRMITIYKGKAEQQDDDETKKAYLDSALYMFDWAFDIFDENEIDQFRWVMNRGRFHHEYSDYYDDGMDKAMDDYMLMMEIDLERATESGDGYYVQIVLDRLKNEGKTDEVIEWINKSEPYAGDDLKNHFSELRDELFSEPEDRVEWLKTVLEDDPDNIDVMEEIYELYDELGQRDDKWDMARQIYEKDRNYDNIMRLARLYNDDGRYEEGNEYLRESLDYTDDSEQKKETLLRLSRNYLNMREFEDARSYAREAMDADPDWGEPYIQIADIYSQTVSSCTSGEDMGRRDRAVYWLVLDYLDKAVEVDSGVERSVENRYSNYEDVMPASSDVHFVDEWTQGGSYMIDENTGECYAWINEETTVR